MPNIRMRMCKYMCKYMYSPMYIQTCIHLYPYILLNWNMWKTEFVECCKILSWNPVFECYCTLSLQKLEKLEPYINTFSFLFHKSLDIYSLTSKI